MADAQRLPHTLTASSISLRDGPGFNWPPCAVNRIMFIPDLFCLHCDVWHPQTRAGACTAFPTVVL